MDKSKRLTIAWRWRHCNPVKLVIVHYHLRPGGIRRIIELATPHLVREAPRPITRIVLATGQCADRSWHDHFAQQLPGVPVKVFVERAFNYLSEQRASPRRITAHLRRALEKLFTDADAGNCLVWAHNLGVGRNLLLARELAFVCAARDIPLVAHHHDWWFDNRWARWPEMRRFGFRTLAASARAVFPQTDNVIHVAINHADAAVLARHFDKCALWLPNLTEPAPPPPAATVRNTRRWLRNNLAHDDAPVWLLPCRSLRRKNIAEALLLTRWLRPEAWLVVTGAASSADEVPYFKALERAAHQHHWRLRLGVLAGDESRMPSVPELLAASEAVLLTSIQEGFGLPYLEAAAAHRPLIARRLSNIAPDLNRFGFHFPQAYDEILVTPDLFNWRSERARQAKLLRDWRAMMPSLARELVSLPPVLAAERPCPVPFSRLSLTAQIEVLARPIRESWEACLPLNPFLEAWHKRAEAGRLRVTLWPRGANRWLGGEAYAQKFFDALAARSKPRGATISPVKVQTDFIEKKLAMVNLYPLLWNTRT
ncbi:MAG: glycosyltransferase family 4 protein [Verrucomicrobia bacterium]|nr:glycosyltransferase family 4 protein [Verrucomicrobiota bacterium]